MIVITHQAPSVNHRPVAIAQLAKAPDKKICILLGLEYIPELVPSPHQVVTGTGILYSQRSGHAVTMSNVFEPVKIRF
jgi:hypothetical protein